MPTIDADSRVVGIVQREDPDTSNYSQCLFVINFSSRLLHLYPLEAAGAPDFTEFIPIEEIKCSYITKVNVALSRPKVLNCFEMVTTGVSHFFSVNSTEERDEWIEAIKQSSLSQKTPYAPATQKDRPQDFGYKNQVVGGVIHKKPIKEVELVMEEGDRSDLTSSGPAAIGASPEHQSPSRTKKISRIIKAGHATKCGAVMKSWKRRFFVLSEQSLGYYKGIEELEPIRSVLVNEMLSVGRSKIHAGKDNLLELVTPSRIFYIQADTEADMNDWIKAFQQAIALLRSSSSSTMPVSTKDRSGSNHEITETHIVIQPYDASPRIVGIPPLGHKKDSLGSPFESPSPEHSNEEDDTDGGLLGTEV